MLDEEKIKEIDKVVDMFNKHVVGVVKALTYIIHYIP